MNNIMASYKGLISFLGNALPDEFDAVLFDLTEKGYPMVEKSDWGASGEDEIRRIITEAVKDGRAEENGFVLNAVTATKDKRLLKVCIYFLKEEGKLTGALAVNMEMDFYLRMSTFLRSHFTVGGSRGLVDMSNDTEGQYSERIEDIDEIANVIDKFGTPADKMTPSERKEAFMDLYDTGVFRLKGAIPRAAVALKVSEKTIYRYLSEIKKMRK